jgi:hypothetical protein
MWSRIALTSFLMALSCGLSRANYQSDEPVSKRPTHQQSKLIQLKPGGQASRPITLCLDQDGNLVVARFGVDPKQDNPVKAESETATQEKGSSLGLIQIYRPDGELQIEFPLDFRPETIASDREGNLYVGGLMAICKYNPSGKLLQRSLPPNLAILTKEERIAIAEKNLAVLAKQSAETTRRQLQLVEQVLRRREEREEGQPADSDNDQVEDNRPAGGLGGFPPAVNKFAAMETGDLLRMREALMRGLEESAETDQLTENRIQQMLSRLGQIKSVAVIGEELFVAIQTPPGEEGFEIWRLNSELQQPVQIIKRLAPAFIELEIQSDDEHLFLPEGSGRQLAVYNRVGQLLRNITLPSLMESEGGQRRISIQNVRLTPQGEILVYAEPNHSIYRLSSSGELVGEVGRFERSRVAISTPFEFDEARSRLYLLEQTTAKIRVLEPAEQQAEPQVAPIAKPVEEWAERLAGEWVMIGKEKALGVIDPEETYRRIAFGPEGKLLLKHPTADIFQEIGTVQLVKEQGNQVILSIKQEQVQLFRWTIEFAEKPARFRLGISYGDPKPIWLATFARETK